MTGVNFGTSDVWLFSISTNDYAGMRYRELACYKSLIGGHVWNMLSNTKSNLLISATQYNDLQYNVVSRWMYYSYTMWIRTLL